MKYFDVLLSRYLGGCGNSSGGDSSDFSTAQVNIVNNGSADYYAYISYIASFPWGGEGLGTEFVVGAGDSGIYTCVLYKGKNMLDVADYSVVVDGDAEREADMVIITGDCTITMTGGEH